MISLPLPVVHPELLAFGSSSRPLRPSKIAKLLGCSMSVLLTADSGEGNSAAQTGNLVHSAAHAFHTSKGDRVADGVDAIGAARSRFPEGDPDEARRQFLKYSADPTHQEKEVIYSELPVRLVLPADSSDPTGLPIHINGTLDQIRRHSDGSLHVWDIKTGKPEEALLDYTIQQMVYTLAARECIDETILPGGLILTKNYFIARAKVFQDLTFNIEQAILVISTIPQAVANVRRGLPAFKPSPEACRWCELKPFPTCTTLYERFK